MMFTRELRTGESHTFADRDDRKKAIASLKGWTEVGTNLNALWLAVV